MIEILEQKKTFHLKTCSTSMIFHIMDSGHLMSLYWGSRVMDEDFGYIVRDIPKAGYLSGTDGDGNFRLEQYPILYPAWGNPDLRLPAFEFRYPDGSGTTDLRCVGYELREKKEKIEGLPTVLDRDARCLELILWDSVKKVEVRLVFGVFERYDAITQSVVVRNRGTEPMSVERLMSGCFSFLDDRFAAMTLTGAWARECHVNRRRISQGTVSVGSTRGASGHGQNPFMALTEEGTDESGGNVWSMNLVYSGSFEGDIEVDMHQNTRFMMGIQPAGFSWNLEPGQAFYSPEAVLVYSGHGLGAMSRCYHRLYRNCLMKSGYALKTRPILINNWEATYFDFNRKMLLALADEAASLGMELFVLDDGWFGRRGGPDSSLGDWYENREKLGGSLAALAEEIQSRGMDFGLWFEPEMVSPDSSLYKAHPDWVIRAQGRKPQLARNQLVLDLSNPKVQDYIIQSVSRVLDQAPISYIKWDMNRNITDWYSGSLLPGCQGELAHRYILGLYRILEQLTGNYPQVLFEGCAGGGGRFDPGMLHYMPQIWASDDTDAIERLDIQQGTSYPYPAISMGCHVSASPNHMTGRRTPLYTRGVAAMAGNLGYELDLTALTEEEKAEIKRQIAFYKRIRETVQLGEHFRLSAGENESAWMYISQDGSQAVVSYVRVLARANTVPKRLKLAGLEEDAKYLIEECGAGERPKQEMYGGSLTHIGLSLEKNSGDFYAKQWILHREAPELNHIETGGIPHDSDTGPQKNPHHSLL